MKCLEKIVNCYPQSDASDGIEQPASLFLVLYSILCPHWSAFGKPWSATDDAAVATDDFLTFLLNQKHGVLIARSWQSSIIIGPCLKVWYCHRPALFDFHLHSEITDLYMPVYRSSPCQRSGAVWKSRWTSWAPVPNKLTVSVDVKQHFNQVRVWNGVLHSGDFTLPKYTSIAMLINIVWTVLSRSSPPSPVLSVYLGGKVFPNLRAAPCAMSEILHGWGWSQDEMPSISLQQPSSNYCHN